MKALNVPLAHINTAPFGDLLQLPGLEWYDPVQNALNAGARPTYTTVSNAEVCAALDALLAVWNEEIATDPAGPDAVGRHFSPNPQHLKIAMSAGVRDPRDIAEIFDRFEVDDWQTQSDFRYALGKFLEVDSKHVYPLSVAVCREPSAHELTDNFFDGPEAFKAYSERVQREAS